MSFYTTNSPYKKKVWIEKLYREADVENYWSSNGFMGTDPGNIIQELNEFTKNKGDEAQYSLIKKLNGEGVEEGQVLEGNEEELRDDNFSIKLKKVRHAVKAGDTMSEQRVFFKISDNAKFELRRWMAETKEKKIFNMLQANPTNKAFGGGKLSRGALTTSDKLDTTIIGKLKAIAMTGGKNREKFNPFTPINIMGQKHFVLVIHDYNGYDLTQDPKWEEYQKYAFPRGKDHPLFTGALGMVHNVIIHTHESIQLTEDGGASADVPTSKCLFLGAQAGVWANGKKSDIITKKFDYDEEERHAIGMIYGDAKPNFTNDSGVKKDWGVISLEVAHSDPSVAVV